MLIRNYWIILVLIVFVKLLKGKQLSSYNIKWMIFYTAYVVWVQAEGDFDLSSKYGDEEFYIWAVFLLPLFCYLLFSFIYQYIKDWRIVKWADRIIDTVYHIIKNLS